jgi:putative ABC transport system permease protein
MTMNIFTQLAIQHTVRRPLRSLITVLGISLGVAIILAVSMLNDTARDSIERTIEELGSGKTDIWIEETDEITASTGTRREGFTEEIMQKISTNPSVVSVHPSLKIYSMGISDRIQEPLEFYLCGVRFTDDYKIRSHILSTGGYPNNPQQIMVGQELARAFEISTGSRLTIESPKGPLALSVSGLLKSDEGSGLLHNNKIVFADLSVAQEFFNYKNRITSLNIVLKPDTDSLDFLAQIENFLPENAKAITDPLMVASKEDESAQLRITLLIYSFISIFIAMFIIYNTLASTVEESRKEIGMLRLVGMTTNQVTLLILRQALIYSVIGSCLGIGFGIFLGWGMVNLLKHLFAYQSFFLIPPSSGSIFIAVGIGIIITMLVSLFPAIKTAKIPPLVVFREREAEKETAHRFTVRNAIGFFFIVAVLVLGNLSIPGEFAIIRLSALVFLFIGLLMTLNFILPSLLKTASFFFAKIFGVSGMLAAKSLRLRLKRTVTTIGAITIATAVSFGTLGMVFSMKKTTSDWMDNTRWADVLIFSISGAEMDESIVKRLEEYPFIKEINPIRYFFVPYEHPKLSDKGFLFQAVYPARFKEFTRMELVEGNTPDAIKLIEKQPAILINVGLARMLGLKQEDTIKLKTQKGITDFTIAGSVEDYTDFVHRLGKIVYGSYQTLAGYWGAKGYSVLQIHLKEGYSEDNAKTRLLSALSGTYDIKILTHSEEKEDVGASIDKIFATHYAITGIMFIIVFMGIFNTVFINVLFQIREFAILRTIGLFARQIRLMVICEALAMGFIGSIFAVAAGIWLGWQMMLGGMEMMGMVLQFHIPWVIIGVAFLLIPPIAILATIYPQRIASGFSITKILQSNEQL